MLSTKELSSQIEDKECKIDYGLLNQHNKPKRQQQYSKRQKSHGGIPANARYAKKMKANTCRLVDRREANSSDAKMPAFSETVPLNLHQKHSSMKTHKTPKCLKDGHDSQSTEPSWQTKIRTRNYGQNNHTTTKGARRE